VGATNKRVDAALTYLDELIDLMGDEKRKADIADKLSKVIILIQICSSGGGDYSYVDSDIDGDGGVIKMMVMMGLILQN